MGGTLFNNNYFMKFDTKYNIVFLLILCFYIFFALFAIGSYANRGDSFPKIGGVPTYTLFFYFSIVLYFGFIINVRKEINLYKAKIFWLTLFATPLFFVASFFILMSGI